MMEKKSQMKSTTMQVPTSKVRIAMATANTASTKKTIQSVTSETLTSWTVSEKISSQARRREVDEEDVNTDGLHNSRQDSLRAELIWCLEVITSQNSFNSCQGKPELFRKMFPGRISENFALSPKKAAYLITEALGPYFESQLLNDINKNDTTYSIQFNEINKKNKKELEIRILYWSEEEGSVLNRHLQTKFIDRALGEDVFQNIFRSIKSKKLALNRALTLGRDGPNVNKKVARLFDAEFKNLGLKNLLNFGTCYLHIVNNAFQKGLEELSVDVPELVVAIKKFFDQSNLRWTNYEKIQVAEKIPKHRFIEHSATRWTTLGPADRRVIEQLKALKTYFLDYIPKHDNKSGTLQNHYYIVITKCLQNPFLESTLYFVAHMAELFVKTFNPFLQTKEPLIHLVYSRLEQLTMIMLSSIIKPEVKITKTDTFKLNKNIFEREKDINHLLNDSSKALPLAEMKLDESVANSLKELSSNEKLKLLGEFKKFYSATIFYINSRIINRDFLRHLGCLEPKNIKNTNSVKQILDIAKNLPLHNIDETQLCLEWELLKQDKDIRFKLDKDERIDHYWKHIFDLKDGQKLRYPNVSKVVKASLSLPHGSADVEREFSASIQHIKDNHTLINERTLNAKLIIIDYLKKFNGEAWRVPIPDELLKLGRHAQSNYKGYIEQQKKLEEKRQRKQVEADAKKTREIEELDDVHKLEEDLGASKAIYKETRLDTEAMGRTDSIKCNKSSEVTIHELKNCELLEKDEEQARKSPDEIP